MKSGFKNSLCSKLMLILALLFVQCDVYGFTTRIGVDANVFYQVKDSTINAIHDVVQHINDLPEAYENSLFKIGVDFGNKVGKKGGERLLSKNNDVNRFLFFLGYISGIDLDMGDYNHLNNAPSLEGIVELHDFFYGKKYGDIYPYWLIYIANDLMTANVLYDSTMYKILYEKDYEQYDDDEVNYAKEHPDEKFSQDVFLQQIILEANGRIHRILRNKGLPLTSRKTE